MHPSILLPLPCLRLPMPADMLWGTQAPSMVAQPAPIQRPLPPLPRHPASTSPPRPEDAVRVVNAADLRDRPALHADAHLRQVPAVPGLEV